MRESIEESYAFIDQAMNGDLHRPLAYQDTTSWAEETAGQFIPDLKGLLNPHWREAGRDHDKVPMDVNWNLYLDAEKKGNLLIIAGRDQSRLVAYHVFFITSHPNYQSTKFLTANVYYVRPEYRGRGYFRKMLDLAEKCANARGVTRAIIRWKDQNGSPSVLEDMGYSRVEMVYEKVLA